MQYINLKEKRKGRIKKNKEYSLKEFISMVNGYRFVQTVIPVNKPWYVPKAIWDQHGRSMFKEGHSLALFELEKIIINEIAMDNVHSSKNRSKKKNKRGKR